MKINLGHIARTVRSRMPVTLLGILAILSLGAYVGHAAQRDIRVRATSSFKLAVIPARATVLAGTTARYTIRIRRTRFAGRIALALTHGLPRGARAWFGPRRTRRLSSTLTIATNATTRAGSYRIRLRGTSGKLTSSARFTLAVAGSRQVGGVETTKSPPFTVSGNVGEPLAPGLPRALDLVLRNPNPVSLSVSSLTVSLQSVAAPAATPALPCTLADFAVQQFSGSYPLTVPALSTHSLSDLGVPSSAWPRVAIADLPLNQDGCQGASLTLLYGGRATVG